MFSLTPRNSPSPHCRTTDRQQGTTPARDSKTACLKNREKIIWVKIKMDKLSNRGVMIQRSRSIYIDSTINEVKTLFHIAAIVKIRLYFEIPIAGLPHCSLCLFLKIDFFSFYVFIPFTVLNLLSFYFLQRFSDFILSLLYVYLFSFILFYCS